jgi:hypothetical protein
MNTHKLQITKANKGNIVVTAKKQQYYDTIQQLATENNLRKLRNQHTSTFQHEVMEIPNECSTIVNNNNR